MNMVGDLKGKVVLLLIVLAMLCMPALGQTTAVDWDNKKALSSWLMASTTSHTSLQQGHRD
jgi:hypothetical protein